MYIERERVKSSEVSLVRRGMNKKKRFPMFKGDNMDAKIIKAVLETEVEGEERLIAFAKSANISEKGLGSALAMLRAAEGYSDEMTPELMKEVCSISKILKAGMKKQAEEDEEKKKAAEMAKQAEEEEKKKKEEEMAKQKEKEEYKYPDPEMEKMRKSFEAESTVLREQLEVMKKSLLDMHDQRELDDWRKRAATELSHYPGKSTDELANQLHAMHKSAPDAAKSLFDTMKMMSDMTKQSAMLRPQGLNGSVHTAPDTTFGKINAIAEQVMAKSDDPLEPAHVKAAKARLSVVQSNPDLYRQYVAEQLHGGNMVAGGI